MKTDLESYEFYISIQNRLNEESERAVPILLMSIIDEKLKTLLKKKLVKVNSSEDSLFEGVNAPLGTLSGKTNFAYRLGLITKDAKDAIDLMRKIRNIFSHQIFECDFSNQKVTNRINEIGKKFHDNSLFGGMVILFTKAKVKKGGTEYTYRQKFCIYGSGIILAIDDAIDECENIKEKEVEFTMTDINNVFGKKKQ